MPAGIVPRTRTLAWAALAAACLTVPAAAGAAPAVGPPTPASLKASKPSFPISPSADARIISIGIAQTAELDSFGALRGTGRSDGGTKIDDLSDDATAATAREMVFAGAQFWQLIWRPVNPDGTTGDAVYEAPQRFKVPPLVRKPVIGKPYQDPRGPQFGVTGTVVTNGRVVKYECRVKRGSATIFRHRRTLLPFTAGERARWDCLDRRVPEAHDGKRLTLLVTVTVGSKRVSASRSFIGR
jgi:hypothetical protein